MAEFPAWLTSDKNRKILAFIGAGIAALAIAAWTVVTCEAKKPETASPTVTVDPTISPTINNNPVITVTIQPPPAGQIEVTYHVCQGGSEGVCTPGSVYLSCGVSLADWAKKECGKYLTLNAKVYPGGSECGLLEVDIRCVASE